jgi:hypothetical protein
MQVSPSSWRTDNRSGPENIQRYGASFEGIPISVHVGTSVMRHGPIELLWARLGHWGADRNGNGVWDRGPVPRTQRMRASELGRMVIYDPVLWTPIR